MGENTVETLSDVVHSPKVPKGLKDIAESNKVWYAHLFSLIANKFGLKNQQEIFVASPYAEALNKYNPQAFNICGYKDYAFRNLLDYSIFEAKFVDSQSTNPFFMGMNGFSLREIVYKMVNGSLLFWDFKTHRKYSDYTGKKPLNLNNGGLYCWLMGGFQLLTSVLASDKPEYLVNWNEFRQTMDESYSDVLKQYLLNNKKLGSGNAFNGIELKAVLSTFFVEYSKNHLSANQVKLAGGTDEQVKMAEEYSRYLVEEATIKDILSHLNSDYVNNANGGSAAQNALDLLFDLFPDVKIKKIQTKETLIEQGVDPILLTLNLNNETKQQVPYSYTFCSVKNLVPGLDPNKPGVGNYYSNLSAVANCPNQYAEYKLKWSNIPGSQNLLVYELRGIGICEQQSLGVEVAHAGKFGITTGIVKAPTHQRAIIKVDNSSWWHYCDSNNFYYSASSLQNLLNKDDTCMSYNYEKPYPANFANTLVYNLVSEEQWNSRTA